MKTFRKVSIFWNQKLWESWLKLKNNKNWLKIKFRKKLTLCLSTWSLLLVLHHAILSKLVNASRIKNPLLTSAWIASICLVAHFQRILNRDTTASTSVTLPKWLLLILQRIACPLNKLLTVALRLKSDSMDIQLLSLLFSLSKLLSVLASVSTRTCRYKMQKEKRWSSRPNSISFSTSFINKWQMRKLL